MRTAGGRASCVAKLDEPCERALDASPKEPRAYGAATGTPERTPLAAAREAHATTMSKVQFDELDDTFAAAASKMRALAER